MVRSCRCRLYIVSGQRTTDQKATNRQLTFYLFFLWEGGSGFCFFLFVYVSLFLILFLVFWGCFLFARHNEKRRQNKKNRYNSGEQPAKGRGGGGQQNDKIKSLNYRLNLSSFHLDFVVVFSFRYLEWKAQIVILFLFYHH